MHGHAYGRGLSPYLLPYCQKSEKNYHHADREDFFSTICYIFRFLIEHAHEYVIVEVFVATDGTLSLLQGWFIL